MFKNWYNTTAGTRANDTQSIALEEPRMSNIKSLTLRIAFAAALSIALLASLIGINQSKAAHASVNNTTAMIYQVFGPYGAQAVRIAQCESTMNPGATNRMAIGNSHAAGLFQILYPSTWYTTSEGRAGHSPYDAAANIRAAHEIFVRDGYSWREWECKP